MNEVHTRFDGLSGDYVRFRPAYPSSLLYRIDDLLAQVRFASPLWLDVGCGTGIFTRQIAERLPVGFRLLGLEPSTDMRAVAERMSVGSRVEYRDGAAEVLPAADGTISVVSAATAAHWFDRQRFYAEAVRVLAPSGLLLIVQYVRDLEDSPAAAAIEAYLCDTGGPKVYARPDYAAELLRVSGLRLAEIWRSVETLALPLEAFIGLALSSSHARASIDRIGSSRVRRDLAHIADVHRSTEGTVAFGYRFELVAARRIGSMQSE